ncbi:MAG TPA: HAMP domain-containing sensor histidine kinase [Elusimicrobiales bacterium]|nr:HAMP domain-containing sensor histidine kinase [Elusimicrobiales bacterium]
MAGKNDAPYTGNFARGGYETVFLVFMLAVAFFMRGNPLIVYPDILYLFLALMVSNLLFNWSAPRLRGGEAWLVELVLLLNMLIITGIVRLSGGSDSYFWVLYLLPIFTAALAVKLFDVISALLFCSLGVIYFSKPLEAWDITEAFGVTVKLSIFLLSAAVLYRTALSKRRTDEHLLAKRLEAERLARELSEQRTGLVMDASATEIGRMVSGVLHDLGNPLTVITLSAEVMAQDESRDKLNLERILKAARYAKGMLSNAMGIVRGREYVFAPAGLREAAAAALQLCSFQARKKNVSIKDEVPADLPPAVISKVHIERVFMNLVSNAVSFSPEGSVVEVRARLSNGKITALVQDNGPGFPEEMLAKGVRAFATTRREQGGTGLGLFVADEIVRRHGGELSISNAPEGGGRVLFELPLSGPPSLPAKD